jgi:nanoRNase/pAp phosphatase (c-di-AMP/oligoRNAs hydrolase)
MSKKAFETIYERNRVIDNIIDTFHQRQHFLILGHKSPDEDCFSSMVAFALIVSKFTKNAYIYFSESLHGHFQYLLNICSHNAIYCCGPITSENKSIDTIVTCDVAKPSMVDASPYIKTLMKNPDILKIEIDHHLGADSQYIGDENYRLVTEANSSSELVGLIALKLRKREDLLKRYNIQTPLSRNVILSVLTGIVGDTNMGQYAQSRRKKRYYDMFSNLYNNMLMVETTKESNMMNKDQIYREIQRSSAVEEDCFLYIDRKKKFSNSIGYVVLDKADMDYLSRQFDNDTIVSVTRSIADHLADESMRLGLVAYDDSNHSNLVQFRLRRSQDYKVFDVRKVLEMFSIGDGGGHEGAIGFRIPKDNISDIYGYVERLVSGIESELPATPA